jgi:serine phosphatase RsbU (regulator of sigma subunit)
VAWHFDPARELGGDICDFLAPEPNTLVVVLGDVSGKGVPAALYGAAIGEMIRGRTFRRRLEKNVTTPAALLGGINRILHERHLEEYYCTLCYAMFEFKKQIVTFANSGLPYPVKCVERQGRADRHAGRAAGIVRRVAVRRLQFRWRPATSSCCARTAFSKRSTSGEGIRRRRR